MALLLSPRFLSLSPNHSLSLRRTAPFNSSLPSSSAIRISSSAAENTKTGGTAVLWFKHDLRIDDHPGLLAASRLRTLIPLYVFDPRILWRFSDETLELLLFAVKDLKKSLRDQGSDLMIRNVRSFKHSSTH